MTKTLVTTFSLTVMQVGRPLRLDLDKALTELILPRFTRSPLMVVETKIVPHMGILPMRGEGELYLLYQQHLVYKIIPYKSQVCGKLSDNQAVLLVDDNPNPKLPLSFLNPSNQCCQRSSPRSLPSLLLHLV